MNNISNFLKRPVPVLAFSILALAPVSAAPLAPVSAAPLAPASAAPLAPVSQAPASARQRLLFNKGWRFQKGEAGGANLLGQGYDLQKWHWKSGQDLAALGEDTSTPAWKDATASDDVFGGRAGFAWFRVALAPRSVATNAPLVLHFAGVDDNATVFLNGQKLATHQGWDSAFDVPLGAAWKSGAPNELAVLVENGAKAGGIGGVGLQIGTPLASANAGAAFNDSAWRAVTLPHDWGIEGPFNQELPGETGKLPWAGVGWYRKRFSLPASDAGKRIYLDIDGAMANSSVYLNGQSVGGWPYGYSSYQLDLTPFVKAGGDNVLAIRLNNPPESSRWYPGGGIYRNVWLEKTNPIHIRHWGVTVTTSDIARVETARFKGEEATVAVAVGIDKPAGAGPVAVDTDIYERGADGQKTGSLLARTHTAADPSEGRELRLRLLNPKRWTPQKPALYLAITTLSQNGRVVDSQQTTFGVRTMEWDAAQGFLLNGQHVRLQGVCLHHDLGALGAAWNARAMERRLQLLQSMGCNAIRTSHNPPAPEFLDLCDRMGFLVLDEFSDTWTQAKKPNGYARLFGDWAERDVRAWVQRDRNHPSVFAWSIGNEVGEQGNAAGHKIAQFLSDIVHSEDATRATTSGNDQVRAGYNGFQKTIDVFGYNYKPGEYGKFHAANPTIPIYGSETASTVSSRGEYVFPVEGDPKSGQSDFQVSSYDLDFPGWASTPDREFQGQDENPFVAGEFVWTGFDYLGEPTPFNSDTTELSNYHTPEERARAEQQLRELGHIKVPSRSSYFGIMDLAGFPKDRFYLYQARWRPDFPMAHILPHWNWAGREGQTTPVFVYTSGDEAELFLNGQSLGRKKKDKFQYRLRWDDVKYAPGELRVVAFKNGARWAQDTVKTTGAPAKISLQSDRSTIAANGQDLSFVTVALTDANGLTVPQANNNLKFEVSGPGEIVATDNGDATDQTAFPSTERRAFNGLAQVIVRAKSGQKGQIRLRATSGGLTSAETLITSR